MIRMKTRSAALATLAAGLLALAPQAAAGSKKVSFYVQAHQDDWQLFVGDRAVADARKGGKVVFVYLTSGDNGRTNGYWQAREEGANASAELLAGTDSSSCDTRTIEGHSVQRCETGNIVSYYFRLPDGNRNGNGFPSTGFHTLRTLYHNGDPLTTVDGASSYPTWSDLTATLQSLIKEEGGGLDSSKVKITAQEHDVSLSPNDHVDHQMVGQAVLDASSGSRWNNIWVVGYDSSNRPSNVKGAPYMSKVSAFFIYEGEVLRENSYSTYCDNPLPYLEWLSRTYTRSGSD
jgi:GlcNAc-PI de-N-acetylase